MSAFQDALASDLDTFINEDEFADEHDVDGVTINAVFQGLSTKEVLTKTDVYYDGTHGQTFVLHAKTEDMPQHVVQGNAISIDDEIYRVAQSTEDLGMTTLLLEVDAS